MNNQIQKLIKQNGVNITIDGLGYGEGNIEALVELVVRECASLAYDGPSGILDHFGVEE
jgi:hypothetical protein